MFHARTANDNHFSFVSVSYLNSVWYDRGFKQTERRIYLNVGTELYSLKWSGGGHELTMVHVYGGFVLHSSTSHRTATLAVPLSH